MKTILVPVDFSDATEPVLAAAIEMARYVGGRVVLAHVLQPPTIWDQYTPLLEQWVQNEEKAAVDRLEALCRRLQTAGVETELRELYGAPGRELADEVRRLRPDYVVMGSHGHSALYDLLMGSTTAYLMRHSPCPLLVIPIRSRPGAEGEERRTTATAETR